MLAAGLATIEVLERAIVAQCSIVFSCKDPTNQAVLGWNGGGIATIIGGVWAIVKLCSGYAM